MIAVACLLLTIHDGDSLRCNGTRIRLAAIDAPELSGSPACYGDKRRWHDCDFAAGRRSRAALVAFAGRGRVQCRIDGDGGYGRAAARCSAGGVDLGCAMIAGGFAVERFGRADCRRRR